MVLILAIIGLAIVSSLLFMVTQGTSLSGAQKFYRTAEEASLGAAEISSGYFANRGRLDLPSWFMDPGYASGCFCGDPMDPADNLDRNAGDTRTCRCDKICNATADWGGLCGTADMDLNPTVNPDFILTLMGTPNDYQVSTKIVDTVQGNSDLGGVAATGELGGSGVVESSLIVAHPEHNPYLYRLEIQADSTGSTTERSRISVLYAF
jgi:hypothetical protein